MTAANTKVSKIATTFIASSCLSAARADLWLMPGWTSFGVRESIARVQNRVKPNLITPGAFADYDALRPFQPKTRKLNWINLLLRHGSRRGRFVRTTQGGIAMYTAHMQRRALLVAVLACLICPNLVSADDPALSKDQIKQFLSTAKVIKSKQASKGVTGTYRLTLSDGTTIHDASFQPIEEHKAMMELQSGKTEMNFVDSYKYNIAAYQLAELIGLDDMVPVYVQRKWEGKTGSLSWWLPVKMDEAERIKQKIPVPDADSWNKQMYKIRVLDQLVYDADPNLTNVLIGENWQIWRIDFSRGFRQYKDPQSIKDLVQCDRQLFSKLKALNGDELAERTKGFLTKGEVKAVMQRRDRTVEHFQKMIAEKGENEVLY